MGNLNAECKALRDNLNAAAISSAKQVKSVNLLKLELTNVYVSSAEENKTTEKPEKEIDQLRIEIQQLEPYNQYLANDCRRKDTVTERQRNSLKTRNLNERPLGKVFWRFETKQDELAFFNEVLRSIKYIYNILRTGGCYIII